MPKDKVIVSSAPIIVGNEDELEKYGELEQIGSNEFYTGRWRYNENSLLDKWRARTEINNVAMIKGAHIVLRKDTGDAFDVKLYKFKFA